MSNAVEHSHTDPNLSSEDEQHAEQAVLGAMMQSRHAIDEVATIIKPSHFFRPVHGEIMGWILRMHAQDIPVDWLTLAAELEKRGTLRKIGGAPYLHTLLASAPVATNAGYYAETVREGANRRAAARLGIRISQVSQLAARDPDTPDLTEGIDKALEAYYEDISSTVREPVAIGGHLEAWLADKQDPSPPRGQSCGLADLDRLTRARPGELIVVAARPGVGKTVLATKFARHTALRDGLPVLFFNLEMSAKELLDRIFAAEASVDHEHIRKKTFHGDDWDRIVRKVGEIDKAPLFVEDNPDIGVDEIAAVARDHHRRHGGLSLLIIDYLQLVRPRSSRRETSREREVAEMSRALKVLAKALDVPVILVAQLNRGPEQRVDRVPQAHDLRESGGIEADADQVWLLHRPEYGLPHDTVMQDQEKYHVGEVQIIVAKNRAGLTASPWFSWRGGYQDIGDLHVA
jgi:replicative DNA helicase